MALPTILFRELPAEPRRSVVQRAMASMAQTLRFWMETEVHVYSFSVAANVLLCFFPFLIVSISLARVFFSQQTTVAAIDLALRDFFPDALGQFLHNNLPPRQPAQFLSILLLLFTANGIFEPLEVALNRIWGIPKNRSFLRNQLVSLLLIFACGGLAFCSLFLTALQHQAAQGPAPQYLAQYLAWIDGIFYKLAAIPITALILFLVYRYLPNGRPPLSRVIPAAIGVGLLLEVLKYINYWVWPWFDKKISREYGVFRYSVTLIFLGFLATMLVLAGAEWAARRHKLGATPEAPQVGSS
jgi:membrane protein